jgi:hypothetical protein
MSSNQPQNDIPPIKPFLHVDLGDLPCTLCPEVYDAESVKEKEVLTDRQERRRFFRGEGCPACYGQKSALSPEEQEHRYYVLLENWYAANQ